MGGRRREEREMWRETRAGSEGKAHVVWVIVDVAPFVNDEEHQPTKYTHQEENL